MIVGGSVTLGWSDGVTESRWRAKRQSLAASRYLNFISAIVPNNVRTCAATSQCSSTTALSPLDRPEAASSWSSLPPAPASPAATRSDRKLSSQRGSSSTARDRQEFVLLAQMATLYAQEVPFVLVYIPQLDFIELCGIGECVFRAIPLLAGNFDDIHILPRHPRSLMLPDSSAHRGDGI